MKKILAVLSCVGTVSLPATAMSADQWIRLPDCDCVTVEDLHELATHALSKRRYNVEEDTLAMLVGEQDGLKVEILIRSNHEILIRWKEGFGHRRDQWLRNLKTDILWRLAE